VGHIGSISLEVDYRRNYQSQIQVPRVGIYWAVTRKKHYFVFSALPLHIKHEICCSCCPLNLLEIVGENLKGAHARWQLNLLPHRPKNFFLGDTMLLA
jgi:hypothetical protein